MAGDNVKLKLKNIEEEDVSPGFVLCDPREPCKVGKRFLAQVLTPFLSAVVFSSNRRQPS